MTRSDLLLCADISERTALRCDEAARIGLEDTMHVSRGLQLQMGRRPAHGWYARVWSDGTYACECSVHEYGRTPAEALRKAWRAAARYFRGRAEDFRAQAQTAPEVAA